MMITSEDSPQSAGLSRRRVLQLLLAPAGAALLSGCGGSVVSSELGFVEQGFAGARLRALMRRSFIEELSVHMQDLGAEWSAASDASIDFAFRSDWRERYTAVAQAREGADIADLFGVDPHVLSDRLVDVSDLAEEIGEGQGGWMQAARDIGMVQGRWVGIPWALTGHAINVRTDLLDEVNAPALETYEDLLEAATLLAEAQLPRAALSMSVDGPNDSSSLAYSLLWSFGGKEIDETTGKVALSSSATRAALRYFVELAAVSDPQALTFNEGGNNNAFLNGEIGLTQNASSIYWRALRDESKLLDSIAHIRYPSGPNGYHQIVEMNTLAVFSHSRSSDAAIDFIRFAMRPDALRVRTNLSLSFFSPPLLDRLEDQAMVWNTDPVFGGLKASNESGHAAGWPAPPSIEAGLVFRNATLAKMFNAVGSGESSIDDAIATASHQLRRVYET